MVSSCFRHILSARSHSFLSVRLALRQEDRTAHAERIGSITFKNSLFIFFFMPTDCIFCKIVEGNIPSSKVYEDDKVLAILDIAPVSKGHVLVLPKKHMGDLTDVPDNLMQSLFSAAKKIGKVQKKVLKADGFNIGMNNGAAAGQVVFHAHVHVIPRFEGDGLEHWPHKQYDEGEMQQVREKLAIFL